jgi:hypothetical protein
VTGPVRQAGRLADDAGRTLTWSIADGQRGRRWRWTVVDRRGSLLVTHTLETDPAGQFVRLESAAAAGLLTLHREADGSIHGNRVAERGVDHLTLEAPAPGAFLIGPTELGVAIVMGAVGRPTGKLAVDLVEVGDDLGIRLVNATIRADEDGAWEVRTNRLTRRAALGADGLPESRDHDAVRWPLEGA